MNVHSCESTSKDPDGCGATDEATSSIATPSHVATNGNGNVHTKEDKRAAKRDAKRNDRLPAVMAGWTAHANPAHAVSHAVRHDVVSQIIRPEVAAFLPATCVGMRTRRDARLCVSAVQLKNIAGDVDDLPLYVQQLPHLTALDLTASLCISACALDTIRLGAPQLQDLRLGWCDGIDADALAVVSSFARLESLNVRACKKVDTKGLAHLPALIQLRALDVSHCNQVSRKGVAHIARISSLESLDLSYCHNVDVKSLVLVSKLTALRRLDVNWCRNVDGAGIAHVVRLPHLRNLGVTGSYGVTEASLQGAGALQAFQALDVQGPRLSPEATE